MSLFKYPGSKNWWYEFQFSGRRYRASTKTSNKNLARDAERARRQELIIGVNRIPTAQRAKRFAEAAEEYLRIKKLTWAPTTYANEKYNVEKLNAKFGSKLVTDFHAEDVRSFQDARLAKGAKPKTINLEYATLRAILKRHRTWAAIQPDCRMLPADEEPGRCLEPDEEQRLIKTRTASPVLRIIVILALCTGMRKKELVRATWGQVDLGARIIVVGQTKTKHGSFRRIPLNDRAMKALTAWAAKFPDRKPKHFLFPSSKQVKKDAWVFNPERPTSFGHQTWEKLLKKANVKARFHDLRHTACTRMLEAGTHFPIIASLMGWSSGTTVDMTKRYGHIGQKAFEAAVSALNGPGPKPYAAKLRRLLALGDIPEAWKKNPGSVNASMVRTWQVQQAAQQRQSEQTSA